jgi:hypothetical protein
VPADGTYRRLHADGLQIVVRNWNKFRVVHIAFHKDQVILGIDCREEVVEGRRCQLLADGVLVCALCDLFFDELEFENTVPQSVNGRGQTQRRMSDVLIYNGPRQRQDLVG